MKHNIGSLIAFTDSEGHVYTGIVASVDDNGGSYDYDVDVLADGVYRKVTV